MPACGVSEAVVSSVSKARSKVSDKQKHRTPPYTPQPGYQLGNTVCGGHVRMCILAVLLAVWAWQMDPYQDYCHMAWLNQSTQSLSTWTWQPVLCQTPRTRDSMSRGRGSEVSSFPSISAGRAIG
eukprot:4755923-Amphidinium_carterae.2